MRWLVRVMTLVLLFALALAGGSSAARAETPRLAARVQFIEFYSPM